MICSTKIDRIDCVFCEGEVVRTEKGRPITLEECGSAQLFNKIRTLIVADAMCLACRAKYIAWIDARAVVDGQAIPYSRTGDSFMALSFRSTFSDEPGPDDMPEFSVIWRPELTPWPRCERCGKPRASAEELEPDEVMDAECSDEQCDERKAEEPR
jgi:hypothetical protein